MKHKSMVAGKDCYCARGSYLKGDCPICDWGLDACSICGAAECELLDMPECPGHRNWRNETEGEKHGTMDYAAVKRYR
jgi:hypothetical protein